MIDRLRFSRNSVDFAGEQVSTIRGIQMRVKRTRFNAVSAVIAAVGLSHLDCQKKRACLIPLRKRLLFTLIVALLQGFECGMAQDVAGLERA